MAIMHNIVKDVLIENLYSTQDGADNVVVQTGYKSKATAAEAYGGISNPNFKTGCMDAGGSAIQCEVYLFAFNYHTGNPGTTTQPEGFGITFTDALTPEGFATGANIAPYEV